MDQAELLQTINSKLDVLLERTEILNSLTKSELKSIPNLISDSEQYSPTSNLTKLANKLQISEEELRMIIEVEKNDVVLLKPISDKTALNKEKMLDAAIVISTLMHYIFGEYILNTKVFTTKLKSLGIQDKGNLGTWLKEKSEYFIPQNKTGRNYEYKLSLPGQLEGLRILKTLLTKEEPNV